MNIIITKVPICIKKCDVKGSEERQYEEEIKQDSGGRIYYVEPINNGTCQPYAIRIPLKKMAIKRANRNKRKNGYNVLVLKCLPPLLVVVAPRRPGSDYRPRGSATTPPRGSSTQAETGFSRCQVLAQGRGSQVLHTIAISQRLSVTAPTHSGTFSRTRRCNMSPRYGCSIRTPQLENRSWPTDTRTTEGKGS